MVVEMRKIIYGSIGLFFLIILGFLGLYKNGSFNFDNHYKSEPTAQVQSKLDVNKVNEKEIQITAVGDILIHESQLEAQYNKETKQYDFRNNYEFVKPYIKRADLAIANLETVLGGGENGYTGYPVFNSPDEVVDALKDSGFNLLTTANNHILDGGSKGFLRTVKTLKDKGIDFVGTKGSKEEESFLIKDVHGIKIGIANYTFETPKVNGAKTINSIKIPREIDGLIDTFNYQNINDDINSMKERIKIIRDRGAEVIIFYIHWGEEYQRQPNKYQKDIAQKLANLGVDIIFASHPHVLQPIETIKSQVDNKETLVVYSMGNFISNQRSEILKQSYSEDGIIVNVKIKKNFDTNKVDIEQYSYIPTWVNRYTRDNNFVYEIVPLFDALNNKQKYNLISEDAVKRAENSEQHTLSLIDTPQSKLAHTETINDKDIEVMSRK